MTKSDQQVKTLSHQLNQACSDMEVQMNMPIPPDVMAVDEWPDNVPTSINGRPAFHKGSLYALDDENGDALLQIPSKQLHKTY